MRLIRAIAAWSEHSSTTEPRSSRISKSWLLYCLFRTLCSCALLTSYTTPARNFSAYASAVSPKHTALISPPSASSRSTLSTLPSPLALWYVRSVGWFVTRARIVHRFMYGFKLEMGLILTGASLRETAERPPYEGAGGPPYEGAGPGLPYPPPAPCAPVPYPPPAPCAPVPYPPPAPCAPYPPPYAGAAGGWPPARFPFQFRF